MKAALFYLAITLTGTTGSLAQKIKIGDQVPDMYLESIYNYDKKTGNLRTDFGNKPLIIDFWFTRCKDCIENMPKIDSLQKKYKGKLNFLLSTFEPIEKVEKFWPENRHTKSIKLPSVTSDSLTLRARFPQRTNPHIVWIDQKGYVKAITEARAVSTENIDKLIAGQDLNTPMKEESDTREVYLGFRPFIEIAREYNKGKNVFRNSFIGGYIPQVRLNNKMLYQDENSPLYHIKLSNVAFRDLYQIAFQQRNLRKSQFVFDSSLTEYFKPDFYTYENLFSYELSTIDTSKERRFQFMQRELDEYFQIKSELKPHAVNCYVVRRIPGTAAWKPSTKPEREEEINKIFHITGKPWSMAIHKWNKLEPYPIIDETNIDPQIKADISYPRYWDNISLINETLRAYGIEVKVEARVMNTIFLQKKR